MKPLNPSKNQPLDEVLEQFVYHIWEADRGNKDFVPTLISDEMGNQGQRPLNPTKQQQLDEVQNQVLEQTKDKNLVEHDQKSIIIVCKDEKDWINPETNMPHTNFKMCLINMITLKYRPKFKDSVIVLDDMNEKLNKDIAYYFKKGRHYYIK